jgi:hypothetical protein
MTKPLAKTGEPLNIALPNWKAALRLQWNPSGSRPTGFPFLGPGGAPPREHSANIAPENPPRFWGEFAIRSRGVPWG